MATVNKNFRIKSGLIVEGTSGTIDGHNILTESTSGDQYILNLIGGETLVKSVDTGVFNVDGSGNLTINANTFDSYGSASAAQLAAEGFAQNAADGAEQNAKSYADDLAVNYDSAGSAYSAQLAAQSYADGLAVNYDAAGAAATAESNAEFYTDNAIGNLGGSGTASVAGNIDVLTGTGIQVNSGNNSVEIDRQTVDTWYDASGSADAAQQAAALYTDNAVSALVGAAPELLDTLNELAAAIGDDANYATTVSDLIAGKQNNLTAGNGIDIDGSSSISVDPFDLVGSANDLNYIELGVKNGDIAIDKGFLTQYTNTLYDAIGSSAQALTDAQNYADTAEADAISSAATYTDGQISNLTTGGNGFQTVNIDDIIAQQATFSESLGATQTSVFEWDASNYRSAKVLVKVANGVHTQISELMITLDTSNNVGVSEYGITYSNGTELAAISADFVLGTVRVLATPANASTDVVVFATLVI